MKITLTLDGGGEIVMTQHAKGGMVKIVVEYGIFGRDTIYCAPREANRFYNKRIADGYKLKT